MPSLTYSRDVSPTTRTDAITVPEKDVHVKLPQALVTQMEQTAEAGHITVDELVGRAVQRFMSD